MLPAKLRQHSYCLPITQQSLVWWLALLGQHIYTRLSYQSVLDVVLMSRFYLTQQCAQRLIEPLNESVNAKIQLCIAFISSSNRLATVIREEAIEIDNKPFAFYNSFCLLKLRYSSVTCVNNNFVVHLIYYSC